MFLDAVCRVLVQFYDPAHLIDAGIFCHEIDDLLNQLSLVSRRSVFVACQDKLACPECFLDALLLVSLK